MQTFGFLALKGDEDLPASGCRCSNITATRINLPPLPPWGEQLGANSGLHIIIFDEIDAICKQRGSMAGSTGVHDTVVNQLLSKIDGVEQLNNILVIGEKQSHILSGFI